MAETIALFGGSFNPPHIAHQMVCLYVLETQPVDAVWMMPTYRHAFSKTLAPFADRYRMCELAAQPFGERVRVSRIEAELDQPKSRTYDTVVALGQRHPDAAFRLVIGADILAETDKWYRWEDVVRLAPPILVGRSGYSPSSASTASTSDGMTIALELPRVSSSEIRMRLSAGDSAVPLVSRTVMNYIAERGLYR